MGEPKDWSTLLDLLARTSFEMGEFRLSSGKTSKFYVDCKMAISHPDARKLMGRLIAARIRKGEIDAVGGLELGAYPIATAVSDAIYESTGDTVRAFVVRKKPKEHGLRKWIEGDVRTGDRALIVDDVSTSGGSVISAIDRARTEGLEVSRAILLIDREESDGRFNIEAQHVKFEALFTLSKLMRQKEAIRAADERSDSDAHSAETIQR